MRTQTIRQHTSKEVIKYLQQQAKLAPVGIPVSFWGINLRDLLKYLLTPEKCGNWPFVFVYEVEEAIKKIKRHNLIPRPAIPKQTAADKILAKVLTKCPHTLYTEELNNLRLNHQYMVQLLTRDAAIKEWPAETVKYVMQQVAAVKNFFEL